MRRQVIAATTGALIVGAILIGILVGAGSLKTSSSPTVTPVPTVSPVSTQTVPPRHHSQVRLSLSLRQFVGRLCLAFRRGSSGFVANNLMYYQYNTEVYYSPFNLGTGNWALPSQIGSWLHSVQCVRVAEPFPQHAVLATRGWIQTGGWGIIDLDIPPGHHTWRLNDFTFGSRAQVMGAFFANDHRSIAYRASM